MIDANDPDPGADGRRIPDDVEVDGVLRIADGTICEGDLTAPGGVILGANVVVRGDIHTNGPVEKGPGARVDGNILPFGEKPELDPLAALDAAPRVQETAGRAAGTEGAGAREATPADRLPADALTSTLDVLLTLALEAPGQEQGDDLGLREDALGDTLEGAYELAVDVYREGHNERPWSRGEVVEILLKQVLPKVLPVTVLDQGRDTVMLRVGCPEQNPHRSNVPEAWPGPVLAFLERIADTVRPGARLSIRGVSNAPGPGGPDHVIARLDMADPATG